MPKTTGEGGDSEPTELVASGDGEVQEVAVVTPGGMAPVAAEVVLPGAWTPPAGYESEWGIVRSFNFGSLVLNTLPRWDARKHGELDYRNFSEVLARHLGIDGRYLDSWFCSRLTAQGEKTPDGEGFVRALFMLYVLREQNNPLVQIPEPVEPPAPPKATGPKETSAGCRNALIAAGLGSVLVCGGIAKTVYSASQPGPQPVSVQTLPLVRTISSVPFRHSSVPHNTTLKIPLSADDYQFLETCGAVGYVMVECKEGAILDPLNMGVNDIAHENHPRWPDSDCWFDPNNVKGLYADGFFGTCGGEKFESTGSEVGGFAWLNASQGTVRDEDGYAGPLRYHPVYPNHDAVCANGVDGVFIAPIVPVSVATPAECTAKTIRPYTEAVK